MVYPAGVTSVKERPPDPVPPLEHQHVEPGSMQMASRRQSRKPGPDHDDVAFPLLFGHPVSHHRRRSDGCRCAHPLGTLLRWS